jgi:hypothetical protein
VLGLRECSGAGGAAGAGGVSFTLRLFAPGGEELAGERAVVVIVPC